jgi:hypothetical protein
MSDKEASKAGEPSSSDIGSRCPSVTAQTRSLRGRVTLLYSALEIDPRVPRKSAGPPVGTPAGLRTCRYPLVRDGSTRRTDEQDKTDKREKG